MFSLPEKFKKDNNIPVKTFLNNALSPAEKKKFREAAEEIRITYQIEGFDIPNLVNEDYNCQAIAFLLVKLKSLKSAGFVAKIIQRQVKLFCVIELTDGTEECFCFADKRLSKQDKNEIVIEEIYVTDAVPLDFNDGTKELLKRHIGYESILNRTNKRAYYMEMMTKAFVICNRNLYSGCMKLLDSKLWHFEENTKFCYSLLSELKQLKLASLKSAAIAERSALNKRMKEIILKLETMIREEQ